MIPVFQEVRYVLDLHQLSSEVVQVTVHRIVKHVYRYTLSTFTMHGAPDVVLGVLKLRYPGAVVLNGVLA